MRHVTVWILLFVACTENQPAGQPQGGATEVGPAGGTVTSADGTTTLEIPANALGAPVSITVEPALVYPAATVVIGVFDFGPNGTQFAVPATLTYTYDPASLPPGADPARFVVAVEESGGWTSLPTTVDTMNHTVSAQVSHFSLYGVIADTIGLGGAVMGVALHGDYVYATVNGTPPSLEVLHNNGGSLEWRTAPVPTLPPRLLPVTYSKGIPTKLLVVPSQNRLLVLNVEPTNAATLYLYDISDPERPVQTGKIQVHPDEEIAPGTVIGSEEPFFDAAVPALGGGMAMVDRGTVFNHVTFESEEGDGTVFVAANTVRVFAVSKSGQLHEAEDPNVLPYGSLDVCVVDPGPAYLYSAGDDELLQFNAYPGWGGIENSAASLSVPGASCVAGNGTTVCVATKTGDFHVIDISSPGSPVVTATPMSLGAGPCTDIAIDGDEVFVACSTSGLQVVDITTPGAPMPAGDRPALGSTNGVAANAAFVFVGHDMGLQAIRR